MEVKSFITIDYSELDDIINDFYGFKPTGKGYGDGLFECVACEEMDNDSDYHYDDITKKEASEWFADKYNSEDLEEFKTNSNTMYVLRTVLLDLVRNDKIPEGDYLVQVSW